MSEQFELLDIYKAVFSLLAGLILGFEREKKDKSAGLKTITIICLGSALLTILSYKMAGNGDPTRIASYVVGGIGFLGGGVIFKEGFTVYGLTTAGIIWIAAAIGIAIGYGEIYIAFIFLTCALIVIYLSKILSKNFMIYHHNKILRFRIPTADISQKNTIIKEISQMAKVGYEIALEKRDDYLTITMDLHITAKQITKLESYLVENTYIKSFRY